MNIIKWRDSFNIGVESMDEQHKKTIELINKLFNVIRDEKSNHSILQILEEMSQYAEKHLQDEEVLLKDINFPDLENHIAMHQLYRDKILNLKQKINSNDDTAVMEMYSFLREWWKEHIMTQDMKYGVFINS